MMDLLLGRAKNLLLHPSREWNAINAEITSTPQLYKHYIAPLAAIGSLVTFFGMSILGMPLYDSSINRTYWVHAPIGTALTFAVMRYVWNLAGAYILALIINALARVYAPEKNWDQAIKVAAYSGTGIWVGNISWLSGISIVSSVFSLFYLYSIYLLYLGLSTLMKAKRAKVFAMFVVIAVFFAWGLSDFMYGIYRDHVRASGLPVPSCALCGYSMVDFLEAQLYR